MVTLPMLSLKSLNFYKLKPVSLTIMKVLLHDSSHDCMNDNKIAGVNTGEKPIVLISVEANMSAKSVANGSVMNPVVVPVVLSAAGGRITVIGATAAIGDVGGNVNVTATVCVGGVPVTADTPIVVPAGTVYVTPLNTNVNGVGTVNVDPAAIGVAGTVTVSPIV